MSFQFHFSFYISLSIPFYSLNDAISLPFYCILAIQYLGEDTSGSSISDNYISSLSSPQRGREEKSVFIHRLLLICHCISCALFFSSLFISVLSRLTASNKWMIRPVRTICCCTYPRLVSRRPSSSLLRSCKIPIVVPQSLALASIFFSVKKENVTTFLRHAMSSRDRALNDTPMRAHFIFQRCILERKDTIFHIISFYSDSSSVT